MITKDCAHPEIIVQMADYFYTLDGTTLDYYGEVYPGGEIYQARFDAYVSVMDEMGAIVFEK